ncbi:hypothetical protein L798_08143 [Zootermopsis nevadensis]|uniref:Uncharacterized protein n=1 Tax=Zootermopsis nevadensis TaxID=136037 RepID=A0A067RCX7_ZOONE|nr:hypothetical protein L798_08143 [Zootermopsis nevadensis]
MVAVSEDKQRGLMTSSRKAIYVTCGNHVAAGPMSTGTQQSSRHDAEDPQ